MSDEKYLVPPLTGEELLIIVAALEYIARMGGLTTDEFAKRHELANKIHPANLKEV